MEQEHKDYSQDYSPNHSLYTLRIQNKNMEQKHLHASKRQSQVFFLYTTYETPYYIACGVQVLSITDAGVVIFGFHLTIYNIFGLDF